MPRLVIIFVRFRRLLWLFGQFFYAFFLFAVQSTRECCLLFLPLRSMSSVSRFIRAFSFRYSSFRIRFVLCLYLLLARSCLYVPSLPSRLLCNLRPPPRLAAFVFCSSSCVAAPLSVHLMNRGAKIRRFFHSTIILSDFL